MSTDFDALKGMAQSSGSSGTNDTPAGIPESKVPDEDDNVPSLNARPESVIDADEVVQFDLIGSIKDEQNVRTASGYGDQIILTLRNPVLQKGELWKSTNEEQPADYKIVGSDDPNIEDNIEETDDGDFVKTGITVHGNKFEGEQVDGFDDLDLSDAEDNYVTLWVKSGLGQRLGRVLDTAGGEWAHHDDPEDEEDYDSLVPGLFERPFAAGTSDYDPEEDGYPRITRTPDLRQDMIGEPLRLLFFFSDETYQGNHQNRIGLFALDDIGEVATETVEEDGEEIEHPIQLEPLTREDDAYAPPRHNSYTVWHTAENDYAAAQSQSDPTDEGAGARGSAPDDLDDATPDVGGSEAMTFEDLQEQGYTTAMGFVEQFTEMDVAPDDISDFEGKVEDAREQDGLSEDVPAEDLRTIIESQL